MFNHSTCQVFGTDCKDLIAMTTKLQTWPNFSTEWKGIGVIQKRKPFHFKILYIPRSRNAIVDTLVGLLIFFQRTVFCWLFYFCWLSRPLYV